VIEALAPVCLWDSRWRFVDGGTDAIASSASMEWRTSVTTDFTAIQSTEVCRICTRARRLRLSSSAGARCYPRCATALRWHYRVRSLRCGCKAGDRVGLSASAVRDVIDSSAPSWGCECTSLRGRSAPCCGCQTRPTWVGNEDARPPVALDCAITSHQAQGVVDALSSLRKGGWWQSMPFI